MSYEDPSRKMVSDFCPRCGQNYGADAKLAEVTKGHAEAINEWANLEGLLRAFLGRVEHAAFGMPSEDAPKYLWAACQYVRRELDGHPWERCLSESHNCRKNNPDIRGCCSLA